MSIDIIHTPCKNCCFAKYENNTQIDCELDLISKYRDKDVEILEAYDSDKEFFIVNKKKCPGHKEQNYFIARDLENASLEEKKEYVTNLLQLNYDVIINAINKDVEYVEDCLLELKKAKIKPKRIHCVKEELDFESFMNLKKILDDYKVSKEWKIAHLKNEQTNYRIKSIEIILNAKRTNFFLLIDGDFSQSSKIVDKANDIVYDKFSTFMTLGNKLKSSLLFNRSVFIDAYKHGVDLLEQECTEYI